MRLKFLAVFLAVSACLPRVQASPIRDLQNELKLDNPDWKVLKETDTFLMWVTPSGLAILLMISDDKTTETNPHHLKQLRNYYRAQAAVDSGSLLEAEPHPANGILYNLVTTKYRIGATHHPPDDTLGFKFEVSAHIPTSRGTYTLEVWDQEEGITGVREATGLVIYANEKGIKDIAAAGETFRRDPYDPAYDKDAEYMVSDERRFDKGFPNHPLSRSRALMEELLKSWTISERIQKIARYHADERKTD